jgi:hypothetical protein
MSNGEGPKSPEAMVIEIKGHNLKVKTTKKKGKKKGTKTKGRKKR